MKSDVFKDENMSAFLKMILLLLSSSKVLLYLLQTAPRWPAVWPWPSHPCLSGSLPWAGRIHGWSVPGPSLLFPLWAQTRGKKEKKVGVSTPEVYIVGTYCSFFSVHHVSTAWAFFLRFPSSLLLQQNTQEASVSGTYIHYVSFSLSPYWNGCLFAPQGFHCGS